MAERPKQEILKEELTAVLQAPYTGKKAVILKHTLPEIIQVAGGQKNFEKAIRYLQKTLSDGGVKFDSATVGEPYSYLKTESHEFFLVDVTLVLEKNEEKITNELTQVAVKKEGSKNWGYIDSSGLSDALLRQLYPQLPDRFTLKRTDPEGSPDQSESPPKSKSEKKVERS